MGCGLEQFALSTMPTSSSAWSRGSCSDRRFTIHCMSRLRIWSLVFWWASILYDSWWRSNWVKFYTASLSLIGHPARDFLLIITIYIVLGALHELFWYWFFIVSPFHHLAHKRIITEWMNYQLLHPISFLCAHWEGLISLFFPSMAVWGLFIHYSAQMALGK